MSTMDREEGDRFSEHEAGSPRAERQENPEAPAPGGSAQGIDTMGERGTMAGGLAAEEDFGSEGAGLTGATGGELGEEERGE